MLSHPQKPSLRSQSTAKTVENSTSWTRTLGAFGVIS
jgi:hypothetical protein